MSLGLAIATVVGAAIFPLMIRLIWGSLVDDFGPIGGFLAAGFVVGLAWTINHGIESSLIYQTGAWVDMGLAAGVGVLTADVVGGNSLGKATPKILAAIVGGILAGLILSFIL